VLSWTIGTDNGAALHSTTRLNSCLRTCSCANGHIADNNNSTYGVVPACCGVDVFLVGAVVPAVLVMKSVVSSVDSVVSSDSK
jgi:hypothetical protein